MARSKKRKKSQTVKLRSPKRGKKLTRNSVVRLFVKYFVIFGTMVMFIGMMSGGDLLSSQWYILILLALNIVISTIATATHLQNGKEQ